MTTGGSPLAAFQRTSAAEGKHMFITRLSVERFSLVSDKPFESVVSSLKGGIRHPYMPALWDEISRAETFEEIETVVTDVVGPTGLMQFAEFDDGGFIRKDRGEGTPNAIRLLIGNPLIMKQMTELVPDAAGYAPVTVLIDERNGRVHLSYDRVASLLSIYNHPIASQIAEALDAKIETLMTSAI